MHKVKCYYCGVTFDRDKEPYVVVNSRRYAHAACAPDQAAITPDLPEPTQEEIDRKKLDDYIQQLFGDTANWAIIKKQLKQYESLGYTTSGVLKTLIYFYEVKNGDKSKANGGIGIVQYVYKDALRYYRALWELQQQQEYIIQEEGIEKYIPKDIEVKIRIPSRRQATKNLFSFLDKEE